MSEASITDIVRDKRDALMADIRDQMIAGAKRFGLEVVDVRIKRADLPAENSEAVFRRMQTERQQRAASYRAQGSQQSQQIKAEADRKVTVILAQAQQQAEQIRGEGDGERNRIFAEAYGADPEFFAFYRSMQAYEKSFANGRTRALISPKSDFFRYFSTPTPAAEPATPAPAARPRPQPRPRRQRRPTDMRGFVAANRLALPIEALAGPVRAPGAARASEAASAGPIDECEEKPHAVRRVANCDDASPRRKIRVRACGRF